jgi:hypothetical protein
MYCNSAAGGCVAVPVVAKLAMHARAAAPEGAAKPVVISTSYEVLAEKHADTSLLVCRHGSGSTLRRVAEKRRRRWE